MIGVDVPGFAELRLAHAVFDVNGTHMLTTDTHGGQAAIDEQLGLQATIISGGAAQVVAVGNGANDAAMLQAADLVCASITDSLLLNPRRLVATLRR